MLNFTLRPGLRELRAFDAALRCGGLGAAAREVGLSQPALTQTVRRLEARLGVRLLQRGPHGSSATPAGALFGQRASRLLHRLAAALAAAAARPASLRTLTDPQIRAHCAIAEARGFAGAARALGLGPPALHRAARALERGIGQPLYRRVADGLVANETGAELARQLALALLEIDQGLHELAAGGGRIAIGTLPLLPRRPLARAIAGLAQADPALAVHLVDGSYADLLPQLRAGRLDVIVGALRAPPPFADLLEEPLFADPYQVAARRGHHLAASKTATPAALADCEWLVPGSEMPRRAIIEALFASLPARPRIRLETSSLEMIIAVLQDSDCATLLSAGQIAANAGLVALPAHLPASRRVVGLTMRADWLPIPAQRAFVAALRTAYAAQEA
jgi:LysR family transcriptional regulator of gallate degradation